MRDHETFWTIPVHVHEFRTNEEGVSPSGYFSLHELWEVKQTEEEHIGIGKLLRTR